MTVAGVKLGMKPVGFGARDTLRLEASMPLYGHEIDDKVNPLEAELAWAIDFSKLNFPGAQILKEEKLSGSKKKLVGLEMLDRGIPRQDCPIAARGKVIGNVTSGSFAPTLKKNIAMGYVPVELSLPGTEIEVLIREKALRAKVVKRPFYKRNL